MCSFLLILSFLVLIEKKKKKTMIYKIKFIQINFFFLFVLFDYFSVYYAMPRYAVNALILCYTFGFLHRTGAGPLDAAFSWARADKLPIEIDVNLPWLPCKYIYSVYTSNYSFLCDVTPYEEYF